MLHPGVQPFSCSLWLPQDNWSQLNAAPPSMDKIQLADYSKFEHPPQYWLAMHALYQFKEANKRLPAPNKIEEADQVVQLAVKFNDTLGVCLLAPAASLLALTLLCRRTRSRRLTKL